MIVTAAALGVATFILSPSRRFLIAGLSFSLVLIDPFLAMFTLALVVFAARVRRIRMMRRRVDELAEDGLLAVELTALGVTAGLPFRNSASLTADQVGGEIGAEIMRALRVFNTGGQPDVDSDDLRSVFNIATSSESSGTPISLALNALVRERRREAAAAMKESLSRLPVKMLFPLVFLILPGFVMLTVLPPLISGLMRFGL